MRQETRWLTVALILGLGAVCSSRAETGPAPVVCDAGCRSDGCCSDGCACLSGGECCCDDCACDHCCVVEDLKTEKKKLYCVKWVPYCRTKCPNPFKCRHKDCETCPECEDCVRYKRVLMKREITTKKPYLKCIPASEAAKKATEKAPPARVTPMQPPPEPPSRVDPPRPAPSAGRRLPFDVR